MKKWQTGIHGPVSPRLLRCGLLTLLTVASVSAPAAGQATARVPEPRSATHAQAADSVREVVREWMAEKNLPGVSVAIGLDGELVWAEGFGWADLEQRVPVTPLTRFRIGSASKGLTSAAVGLLYERGKLELDAPVRQYVPSFPEKRWPISTRQLMGHTAGIRHYRGDEEVFAPLGMRHTVPDYVFRIVPHRASFYVRDSVGRLRNARYVDESNKWAGGGFLSTPSDLVRFGFAMLDAELLEPETVKLLWTPLRVESGESTGYGLGWFIRERGGGRVIASPGSSVGGKTVFVIFPKQDMVISVMSNVTGAEVPPIWLALARFFSPGNIETKHD